ncbi:hypothetical protein [Enterococcus avium]|uniref:hypothetical protein n=1 Tax=Enterococcus avium TaxID=33945 RepID=UPI001F59D480|nr:hypothetical protein [Enterococcus avium]
METANLTMTHEELIQLVDERAEAKISELLARKQESKNFKTRFCKLVDCWVKENDLSWKVKDNVYGIVKGKLEINAISDLNADNYDEAVQTFEEVKHYWVKETKQDEVHAD